MLFQGIEWGPFAEVPELIAHFFKEKYRRVAAQRGAATASCCSMARTRLLLSGAVMLE